MAPNDLQLGQLSRLNLAPAVELGFWLLNLVLVKCQPLPGVTVVCIST
jgi:hypothetical protein